MHNNEFSLWDSELHKTIDQLKRILYSLRIKDEDVTINHSNKTAVIIGTDGKYEVSLTSCSCYDFTTRHVPCKHIYRLASELGYLSDLPEPNRKASKEFKDSLNEEIEHYRVLYLNGAISLDKFIKIVNALNSK